MTQPTPKEHWEQQLDQLWTQAQKRHQGRIVLRPKHERLWLWRFLNFCLRIVTFGRGIDLVDGNYYVQWGYTIWTPGDGSNHYTLPAYLRYSILSHEIDHLDHVYFGDHDARSKNPDKLKRRSWLYRWWHQWRYLCWPLPFRFARYREQIELWGHERNLEQHIVAHQGKCQRWFRKWLVHQLSGPTYAWMCSQERAFQRIDASIARIQQAYHDGALDHLHPPRESSAQ